MFGSISNDLHKFINDLRKLVLFFTQALKAALPRTDNSWMRESCHFHRARAVPARSTSLGRVGLEHLAGLTFAMLLRTGTVRGPIVAGSRCAPNRCEKWLPFCV